MTSNTKATSGATDGMYLPYTNMQLTHLLPSPFCIRGPAGQTQHTAPRHTAYLDAMHHKPNLQGLSWHVHRHICQPSVAGRIDRPNTEEVDSKPSKPSQPHPSLPAPIPVSPTNQPGCCCLESLIEVVGCLKGTRGRGARSLWAAAAACSERDTMHLNTACSLLSCRRLPDVDKLPEPTTLHLTPCTPFTRAC